MNDKRIYRISEEIRKIMCDLIANEVKDPRIHHMTSVTQVQVTRDLRYVKIFISVFGSDEEKDETIKGLESAKGFIRKEIGSRLDLRYVPEPLFYLDKSIEQGIYISQLIEKVNKEDQKKEKRGSIDE